MSSIDLETLLKPLSDESPCGPNLDADPAFFELDQRSKGKPERFASDNKVIPAEAPDWRDVKTRALGLLGRTKDLRVGVLLGRALLHTDSWGGFRDGLELVRGMVDQFWEKVHPLLDPEDGNDPVMRVNILTSLGSSDALVKEIREYPLVEDRQLGRFSLRDVLIASGQLTPAPAAGDRALPTAADVDSAFMTAALPDLKQSHAAIVAGIEAAKGIETSLTQKVGAANSVSFQPLVESLEAAIAPLAEVLNRRGEQVAVAGVPGKTGNEPAPTGEISSREDAVRMLEKISDYFKRHEPSSPVPILLERAKGLVSKSFVEIVRDLAPEGVNQLNVIRGVKEE